MIIPGTNNPLGFIQTMQQNQQAQNASMEKLSTGMKINRAKDDPSGLITSENLRAVLAFLDAETRSMQRTTHVVATADAALSEVGDQIRRAEALEVANANESGLSDEERAANEMEIQQIHESVNRLTENASFNGQKLFDGDLNLSAPGGQSQNIDKLQLDALAGSSEERLDTLRSFRDQVNTVRGSIGAFSKNVLGSQIRSASHAIENLSAAESMIRDTNFAEESSNLARLEILTQASMKSLSFLNSDSASVLKLIT